MHNFHDSSPRGAFPAGANGKIDCDVSRFGSACNNDSVGNTWMVHVLAYLEHEAIYAQWDFGLVSAGNTSANLSLIRNQVMDVYQCASSPLPTMGSGANPLAIVNYVGISGAVDDLIDASLNYDKSINGYSKGIVSGGGVFVPNRQIGLSDITDGSSNVMAVSEHADYLFDSAGVQQTWTASNRSGWQYGIFRGNGTPPNLATPNGGPVVSTVTTIRWPINKKTGWATLSNANGVGLAWGPNIPLNSAHPGGVQATFADGSVHYISETIDMETLAKLTMRDDGRPTGYVK